MSLEIDFSSYLAHFNELNKPDAAIKVFGEEFKLDDLRVRAKEIAEPKNPVNDKKLPQKKGFSSSFIFGKNGKSRLLERIYETNIDAFFRAFPEVVPPTWFIENCDVESVVDHLLSFNELEKTYFTPKKGGAGGCTRRFSFCAFATVYTAELSLCIVILLFQW